jgi:selenide, water dikinase
LPCAINYAEQEIFPGGLHRNREHVLPMVRFTDRVTAAQRAILFDPETSGGLLLVLDPDQARSLLVQAESDGLFARLIGEVAEGSGISVE